MKKKSPLSIVFISALILALGYAMYRWVIKPFMDKRVMEQAMEKGCDAVIEKFQEKREEMAEDLAKLLEKIEEAELQQSEHDNFLSEEAMK